MTPGVYLALAVAALFGVITVLFALADARIRDQRQARRDHPSWPHNTTRRPRR